MQCHSVLLQRVVDQRITCESHASDVTLMQRLTLNGCLCHGEGGASRQRSGKWNEITLWCYYNGEFTICACVESRGHSVSPSFTLSVLPSILVVAG